MAKVVNQVQASKAVLIEVMNILGLYRDHLILVGGWVPELLLPNRGHMGSLDVDLAVDVRGISQYQYDTILQRLTEAGYKQETNCFLRRVKGAQEPVKLDLITGENLDGTAANAPARVQELLLGKLRGTDLAFEVFEEIDVTGEMPDGGQNTVRLRIVRIEAFIAMKAIAMSDRIKEKDAYDIYFCLKHFPAGIGKLAKMYQPILQNELVQEGLAVLHEKFRTIDSVGPLWAAQVADENGADRELVQREAFELMNDFLAAITRNAAP
jgi:nucleotidyltransferase AbiEii toxin of type IV toxin-antitoxin system